MAHQPKRQRQLTLHSSLHSLLLLLLLPLLQEGPSPVHAYVRAPQASLLLPSHALSCSPVQQLRGAPIGSGTATRASVEPECPRCVLLMAGEESRPVVVAWEGGLEALRASGGQASLSVLGGGNATPAATSESPLEVVPVEVSIAAETLRALGLPRRAQKRHIFLPLLLLGQLGTSQAGESHQVGGPPGGPQSDQETQLGSADAPKGLNRASLLRALKDAACRALKWEGVSGCETPTMQLVAHVAEPKTKGILVSQLARQTVGQLPVRQTANEGQPNTEGEPLPALLPLTSDEEALRVLRAHYEPLLAQYHRQPHSPTCITSNSSETSSSGISSNSSSGRNFVEPSSVLRILRLPRGPRLSLQLQMEPAVTVPLAIEGAPARPPPPPPPLGAEAPELLSSNSPDGPPPYQMVSLYKFFPVGSSKVLAELLRALWGPRGVLGRAYIAPEGLNAQLAVPSLVLPSLLRELQQIPGLEEGLQVTLDCSVPFKEYWQDPPFDALHVRPRQQVLRDGFEDPLDWGDCGEEVEPAIWHRKLSNMLQQQQQQQKRKVVLLDMRNASEYAVGHFRGAECVETPTFADSFSPGGPLEAALLKAGVRLPRRKGPGSPNSSSSTNEDVEVLMYCTGGIRCVKAGAFVKQVLGFPRVTRLKGGILAYKNFIKSLRGGPFEPSEGASSTSAAPAALTPNSGEEKGTLASQKTDIAGATEPLAASEPPTTESLFVGSNYVFDNRMCQQITPDLLARCTLCEGPTGRLSNCGNRRCGRRVALCSSCSSSLGVYCSSACAQTGALEGDRDRQAQEQRRLHARYVHNKLVQQRGLYAIRAQQLLAALKHSTATGPTAGNTGLPPL